MGHQFVPGRSGVIGNLINFVEIVLARIAITTKFFFFFLSISPFRSQQDRAVDKDSVDIAMVRGGL